MTTQQIMEHIERNMERWLFSGNHVCGNHINATDAEMLSRLGKYEDGRLINRSSTFIDFASGDDIIDGIREDIKGRAEAIRRWLECGSTDILGLYFDKLPYGVDGIICSVYEQGVKKATGYYVVLCRNEQYPFYLLNTYPVRRN